MTETPQSWNIRVENEFIRDTKVWKTEKIKRIWSCDLVLYNGSPSPTTRIITLKGIRQLRGHLYPAAAGGMFGHYWATAVLSLPIYRAMVDSLHGSQMFQQALSLGVVDPIAPLEEHPRYVDMVTGVVQKPKKERSSKRKEEQPERES